MYELEKQQYVVARHLFVGLGEYNLCVDAVLAGTAPGQVWVDDVSRPRVGLAVTSEGYYLAGDVTCEHCYASLKELLPFQAYLHFSPAGWQNVLDRIWKNAFARQHSRRYLRFQRQRLPDWRDQIPDGFQLLPVGQQLLSRTEIQNHKAIVDWVASWHSAEYFLEHGFGFCLLHGDTLASWCIADCVLGHRCEIGINTDLAYRRRGLATITASAVVDYCLDHGLTQIGWHCLASNTGSRAVAQKVGFVLAKEYSAYSASLPAENASDLTPEEYRDWAEHYERASQVTFWYAFYAAEAWALAGNTARALSNLQGLVDGGWRGPPGWVENNWRFALLRDMLEFQAILATLRGQPPQ